MQTYSAAECTKYVKSCGNRNKQQIKKDGKTEVQGFLQYHDNKKAD